MKHFRVLLAILALSLLLSACGFEEMLTEFGLGGSKRQEKSIANKDPFATTPTQAPSAAPEVTTPPPTEPSVALAETTPPTTEPKQTAQFYYVNVTDNLFIRTGPGKEYEKIGILPRGYKISVLYFQGDWGYIDIGWINKDFLSETPIPPLTSNPSYTDSNTPGQPGGLFIAPEVITTENGYQIVRANRSYYNGAGQLVIEHYYDYVVLNGSTPGVLKINARLKEIAESFLWSENDVIAHAEQRQYQGGYAWCNTMTSRVTYVSNRCVCISVDMAWYMGGVYNGGTSGYVFDLQTGEIATLSSLIDEDPATLEKRLKDIIWEQLNTGETPWEGSYEKLQAYTLDSFDFSISGGQILIHFPEYEFFSGAHGPVTIATGIYV